MKSTKYLIIILFSSLILSGCQENTRKVASDVPQSRENVLRDSLKILDSLVFGNRSKNAAAAIGFAQQGARIARELNTPAARTKSYLMLGSAYSVFKIDSGFYFCGKARQLTDSFNLAEYRGKVFFNLGMLNRLAGNYKSSVILLDSALAAARLVNDSLTLSNSLNSLGNVFLETGDKLIAQKMYNAAFAIAKKKSLFLQMGAAMGNLAKFETDPKKSRELKNNALAYLAKSNGSGEPTALILINIANHFPDPDSALYYFKQALNKVSVESAPEAFIGAYNNMAYSYLEKGDLTNAEKCITEHAMPVAVKTKNLDLQSTVFDTYADILRSQGRSAEAKVYQKKSEEARQTDNKKAALMDVKLRESILKNAGI